VKDPFPRREEIIMPPEIVPRDYYSQEVSPTRGTRKRLAKMEQEAIVKRAAFDAAAQDAAHQLEAEEQLAFGESLLRLRGAYDLAEYGSERATRFNQANIERSRGNQSLAPILRAYEETAAVVGQAIIYNYGSRR